MYDNHFWLETCIFARGLTNLRKNNEIQQNTVRTPAISLRVVWRPGRNTGRCNILKGRLEATEEHRKVLHAASPRLLTLPGPDRQVAAAACPLAEPPSFCWHTGELASWKWSRPVNGDWLLWIVSDLSTAKLRRDQTKFCIFSAEAWTAVQESVCFRWGVGGEGWGGEVE